MSPSVALPLTVVVCTRDRTRDLARCLGAIARLEPAPAEVIVVDSASTDGDTRRVVEEAMSGLPALRYAREELPGLDRARNRGIREATQPIVAWVDDDAEPEPRWGERIVRAFADPAVGVVTGRVLPASVETAAERLFERYGGGMDRGPASRTVAWSALTRRDRIETWKLGVGANLAARRALLVALGGFDPALDVGTASRGGGDLDLLRRALAAGAAVRYEAEAVVRHHHRRTLAELRAQLEGYGTGCGAYLCAAWRDPVGRDRPAVLLVGARWALWLLSRVARGLVGRHPFPLSLLVAEARGALRSGGGRRRALRAERALAGGGSAGQAAAAAPGASRSATSSSAVDRPRSRAYQARISR